MAFNPLQNFLSGQQAGQMNQAQEISGRLAQSDQPTLEPEFQRLMSLDPARAKKIMDVSAGGDVMRSNAQLKDAKTLKYLLGVGDFNGANQLLDDRKGQIGTRASQDTDAVRELMANQDYSGAMNAVDSYISLFDPNAPQAGSQAKAFQDAGDGIVFNPNTGNFDRSENSKVLFDELAQKQISEGLDVKDRQSINKDITGLLKDTTLINKTAKDLSALQKTSGGPASIAIVFKFMKALDPTSVVREGEFSTAENSAGTPDKIRNYYNKVVNGERLGPSQIADFIKTAQQLSNSAVESSGAEINKYLSTYEGTLGKEFSSRVLKRIPARFEMKDEATPPLLSNDFKILSVD
jgi:hypothetical protein